MFGSDILEVATGLVFVYLLMSLVATAAREAWESWSKQRGLSLENGLLELFGHEAALTGAKLPPGTAAGAEPSSLRAVPTSVSAVLPPVSVSAAPADAPSPAAGPPGAANDQIKSFLEHFYDHPLINSLFKGKYHPPERRAASAEANRMAKKLPSYIPSASFADAVLEVAEGYLRHGTGGAPLSFDRLSAAAWAVPNPQVGRILLLAIKTSGGDVEKVRQYLRGWYDSAMDRVAGWYRRRTQTLVFAGGLVLSIALNVNTMVIAHALHQDKALRTAVDKATTKWLAAQPHQNAVSPTPVDPPQTAKDTTDKRPNPAEDDFKVPYQQLQALGVPIGWGAPVRKFMMERLYPAVAAERLPPATEAKTQEPRFVGYDQLRRGLHTRYGSPDILAALEIALGWLLTAFAITLGAPFWFDVLNTIMVVRSTVKPTEKSPDESSKDLKSKTDNQAAKPAADTAVTSTPVAQAPPLSSPDAGAAMIALLDPALRLREEEVAAA